ncbi:hypothetical protein ACFL59_10315 [Planctomycetota bacterium]
MEPIPVSGDDARFAVIGDADMVSDLGARVLGGSGTFRQNIQFVVNLIDWSLLDEGLIKIRSRGGRDRPLKELSTGAMLAIEIVNYAIPLGLIVGFGLLRFARRKRAARRKFHDSAGTGSVTEREGTVESKAGKQAQAKSAEAQTDGEASSSATEEPADKSEEDKA